MKLRPHQTEAIAAIRKTLQEHDRAQCYMACGSGKTLVGLGAANEFEDLETLLILVPSLALVRQVRMTYNGSMVGDCVSYLAVCSDDTVGEDSLTVDAGEVGCPVTTDVNVVRDFVEDIANGLRVVFCTYQSARLLEGLGFDLGIFDEAHKTAGGDKSFGFALHDDNVTIRKRLFMTATPKHAKVTKDSTETVFSMDDEKVYGPVAYRLSFREAVNRGIICDYRILISGLTEEANTDHEAAMQVALEKAMRKVGAKKAFTFHRSVKSAQSFAANEHSALKSTPLHINGAQNTDIRGKIMQRFEKAKKSVLTNARCLTEGVDVPTVDMVAFIDPKASTIDIVQAAGRAMRNSPGKKCGYILLPVFGKNGETDDAALDRSGFSKIWDVLQAMQEQDEMLAGAIRLMREKQLDGEDIESEDLPNIEFMGDGQLDMGALQRAITVRVVERLSGIGSVEANLQKLRQMYSAGEDRPHCKSKLGQALNSYTRPSSDCFRPEIAMEFSRWLEDKVERNLRQLQEMYDAGHDRPPHKTKLGAALTRYASPTTKSYRNDTKDRFARWFVDNVQEKLEVLQVMHDDGLPKPHRSTEMGEALHRFTQSRNPKHLENRKRFPRWSPKDTVEKNLEQLQEMYDRGEDKPVQRTTLGGALCRYSTPRHTCFRPEVRARFKRWFPEG